MLLKCTASVIWLLVPFLFHYFHITVTTSGRTICVSSLISRCSISSVVSSVNSRSISNICDRMRLWRASFWHCRASNASFWSSSYNQRTRNHPMHSKLLIIMVIITEKYLVGSGAGMNLKVGRHVRHKSAGNFFVTPFHFFGSTSAISQFREHFRGGQFTVCLFFYSWAPMRSHL